jgi:ABC-2 type transport system ATP-binding protein
MLFLADYLLRALDWVYFDSRRKILNRVTMSVIKVTNLNLKRGKADILKAVSFDIPENKIVAFVGANGAGKTSTIEAILGLAHYQSGEIELNGINAKLASSRKEVMYVPEKIYCKGIKAKELLLNALKLQSESTDMALNLEKIDNLCKELMFPVPRLDTNFESLSTGQQKQIMLIRAFLVKAKLYIFDEPTSNLDPVVSLVFYRFVKKMKDTTFFISSHNLYEIEHFANYLLIIDEGEIKYSGTDAGQSFLKTFAKIKNITYALDELKQKK